MTTIEERDDLQSLRGILRNLEGLSMGVLPLPMREILAHMNHHTVGVPKPFLVPLRRLNRVIVSYHEQ